MRNVFFKQGGADLMQFYPIFAFRMEGQGKLSFLLLLLLLGTFYFLPVFKSLHQQMKNFKLCYLDIKTWKSNFSKIQKKNIRHKFTFYKEIFWLKFTCNAEGICKTSVLLVISILYTFSFWQISPIIIGTYKIWYKYGKNIILQCFW